MNVKNSMLSLLQDTWMHVHIVLHSSDQAKEIAIATVLATCNVALASKF